MSVIDTQSADGIPVVDDCNAPEITAEGFSGAVLSNGVVKLNLISARFNVSTQRHELAVVARLAIPLNAMVVLQEGIGQLLNMWEKDGHIKKEAAQ